MRDLLIGVLGFAAVLALGAIAARVVVVFRRRRRQARAREDGRRESDRKRLLSSLETLDLAMARLTTAALRGSEQFARERATGLSRVVSAADRTEDEELRRLMEAVVARCDALSAAGQAKGDARDRLVRQLGEAQRQVYRRMEVLLDQVFDG